MVSWQVICFGSLSRSIPGTRPRSSGHRGHRAPLYIFLLPFVNRPQSWIDVCTCSRCVSRGTRGCSYQRITGPRWFAKDSRRLYNQEGRLAHHLSNICIASTQALVLYSPNITTAMAETCIVCLGELVPHDEDSTATEPPLAISSLEQGADVARRSKRAAAEPNKDDELVAHLLPCGHNLHNDCLKPWVERANSCPICRASFNMVELSVRVGGMLF